MAKSKNHTNHNQNSKAHRNGIKKPKTKRTPSMMGCDQKYLKNLRYSRKHNKKAEDLPKRDRKVINMKVKPWNVHKVVEKKARHARKVARAQASIRTRVAAPVATKAAVAAPTVAPIATK